MVRKPPHRPRKQFKVEATMNPVPLPPERKAAYMAAWRLIFDLIRKPA